jgi:23S rRNA pseudouridine1911/1915/1917 synthase
MARDHITKADSYLVTWTVEHAEVGHRLDLFLKTKYRKLSREYLQRAIKEGKVTLNHKPSKPGQLLRLWDKVFVLSTKGSEPEVNFNYKKLYEDDQILVIDKPGNLPVHPTGRYFFNTLLTQLRVDNGNEVDQTKEFYIVHRIDRETSGVMVIGKTPEATASLTTQFEKRETQKEYLAIVVGEVPEDDFTVDAPLATDPRSEIRIKMHVVELDGEGKPLYVKPADVLPALTRFQVVERYDGFTLLRCLPHTGRQHQIRVHLWHKGFPLAGDKLYGTEAATFLKSINEQLSIPLGNGLFLERHALHAHKLSLRHPQTKEMMEFTSPLPAELQDLLSRVKK